MRVGSKASECALFIFMFHVTGRCAASSFARRMESVTHRLGNGKKLALRHLRQMNASEKTPSAFACPLFRCREFGVRVDRNSPTRRGSERSNLESHSKIHLTYFGETEGLQAFAPAHNLVSSYLSDASNVWFLLKICEQLHHNPPLTQAEWGEGHLRFLVSQNPTCNPEP